MENFTRLIERFFDGDHSMVLIIEGPEITLTIDTKIIVKNHPDESMTIEVGGYVIYSTKGKSNGMHGYYIEGEIERILAIQNEAI